MATIEKRGNSYRITVSQGYDLQGKQLRAKMTWTPEPGMTPKQIQKELNKQAVLFEERSKFIVLNNSNIRFGDFVEIYMEQYAKRNLKKSTINTYSRFLPPVIQALGHIKLKNLMPGHIVAFYSNMQEEGIRTYQRSIPTFNFKDYFKAKWGSEKELIEACGTSYHTIIALKNKQPVLRSNARHIAESLGLPYNSLFEDLNDMRPLKPQTIHNYHTVVSSILIRAVKWGYIEKNPAKGIDLPSFTAHAAYLDEDDAVRLLELLQKEPVKWRTPIMFDLLSGLRRAEILGLRWCDVDIENAVLHVRQTWNYTGSDGCYVDTPKTETSERRIKVSETAVLLLLEHQRWQNEQRNKLGDAWYNEDDRIFTDELGRPLRPSSFSLWFSRFMKSTDLPYITVHSLRHTYASLQIAEGIPLLLVSRSLGHKQIDTTANIYAHVIASAEAKAAQTFDRYREHIIIKQDAPKQVLPDSERQTAAGI